MQCKSPYILGYTGTLSDIGIDMGKESTVGAAIGRPL